MATKSSKDKSRYWKMRSGLLSLSILGVLPVIALIRAGNGTSQTTATAGSGQLATISQQAASTGGTSSQSQTVSSQSTTKTTHTRTAAS